MAANEILAVGDEAQAEYEAKQEQTQEQERTEEVVEQLGKQEEVTTEVKAEEEAGKDKPEAKAEDEDGYYFGGELVEIEVPDEIASALKDAGIDADTVVKELFAKDGNFELTEATKSALDAKFGKTMVDGYLNLFRQQNTATLQNYKAEHEALQKQIETNTEDFMTLVGGEDGWVGLNDWATENLTEAELESVNAAMSLPPEHYKAQRAVIEALKIRMGAGAAPEPAVKLPTDEGSSGAGSSSGGIPRALTREEFQAIMFTDKYKNDKAYAAQVDAVRVATQKTEKAARR